MSDVSIEKKGDRIVVKSPFNRDFVSEAKNRLAGRWLPAEKAWSFRASDEKDVRAACVKFYGTDGESEAVKVDVLVKVGIVGLDANTDVIEAFGKTLVKKYDRDARPKMTDGVSLYEGPNFPSSHGSRKNPRCGGNDVQRMLLVRDVPLNVAQEAITESPETFSILSEEGKARAAMVARRDALLAELAELNAALGITEATEAPEAPPLNEQAVQEAIAGE